jgi:hypothetical protein
MVKAWLLPYATETLPAGDMLPLAPALAVIGYMMEIKYALIVWFAVTFVTV